MPAHIKSSMFGCALTIPITNGKLNMGTWQVIKFICAMIFPKSFKFMLVLYIECVRERGREYNFKVQSESTLG
ncbi:hypothetical protein VIGAN_01264500 [Vigna angularis var. angularis]|uniref:Uncharacterized protein n=2 Tax=Phaseolus angularis TaxID=3914 RepID=A0A0S3R2F5_PHAAN|nr:hypothetical protein VIGAN_01264500 [Vigna angularis var. angularis]